MGEKKSNKKCSIDGCNKKPVRRGYCSKHWYHIETYGHILERTIYDANEIKENSRNKKTPSNNKSGYPGVYQDESCKGNEHKAKIYVNNKRMYLGKFDTFEEAKAAKIAAEIEYWGEFAPNQD